MPERQISDLPKNLENPLAQAHGAVPYGMTNDYMFRAVLQSSVKTLRGLICSLLHLTGEEVVSVWITNPIILGNDIDDKEFRLDICVLLNDKTILNLEMQVGNQLNWEYRSLLYLCRAFDQLCHGEDYSAVKPVIHIGFLDYTLFPDSPEFYATNKMINVKTHKVYSDMLTLCVVDLTRTDLATDEDKKYHIDDWAALFKAATWEEIKMLASKNEYMNDAAQTMYLMSAEERIRKRCQDREDYYQDLRSYERKIDELDTLIQNLNTAIKDQDSTIKNQDAAIQNLNTTIKDQDTATKDRDDTIQNQEQEILRLQAEVNKLRQQP